MSIYQIPREGCKHHLHLSFVKRRFWRKKNTFCLISGVELLHHHHWLEAHVPLVVVWPLSHTTRKTKDVEKALGGDPSLFLARAAPDQPPSLLPARLDNCFLNVQGRSTIRGLPLHTAPSSFAESMTGAKHYLDGGWAMKPGGVHYYAVYYVFSSSQSQ